MSASSADDYDSDDRLCGFDLFLRPPPDRANRRATMTNLTARSIISFRFGFKICLKENSVNHHPLLFAFTIALFLICLCTQVSAQTQLSADLADKIDRVANDTLAKTGVPSASISIVKDGQIVYRKAYGDARLDPK